MYKNSSSGKQGAQNKNKIKINSNNRREKKEKKKKKKKGEQYQGYDITQKTLINS